MKILTALATMVLGAALTVFSVAAVAEEADLLLLNGRIYTVDTARPRAEALAVREGKLLAVGSNREVSRLAGSKTRRIDLKGAFVMPGLVDGHVHPVTGGLKTLYECNFPFTSGPEEIKAAVTSCAGRMPAGTWIRGGQWDSGFFDRHSIASPRAFLDAITQAHPVVLVDDSLHNAWANTAALRAMGIDADTPDPEGGRFVRGADGQPNGLMLENAYRLIFRPKLPSWTPEQVLAAAREANLIASSYGITAVKDANSLKEYVEAFHELDRAGKLRMHVAVALNTPTGARTSPLDYDALVAMRDRFRSPHVDASFVKLFLDGVPTPARTAAMLDAYAADHAHGAEFTGETNFTIGTLARDVTELDRRGFTVKMHAAGDRSVRLALDAIEVARRFNGQSGLRHELAHAGYIDPQDITRFAQLDAVADFSPILWHPSPIIQSIIGAVGERGRRYWPTRSLLEAGATLLVGSDWPAAVREQNPWVGIEALVTRRDPRGETDGQLWPEQAISLEDALRLYTLSTARALRLEQKIGSLTSGKSADFIVLDRDLFELPIEAVGETQVRETWFEGERIYTRPAASSRSTQAGAMNSPH